MRWLEVDKGVVRFARDSDYLFLAWAGVIWLIGTLVFLLSPNLRK